MGVYNHTVIECFEQQVVAAPNSPALFDTNTSLTYQQLDELSNQWAHYFRIQGVKEQNFVALLLEPGIEFIICILAILKLGAIYVPLDILSPANRLKEILEDASPCLFLTTKSFYKTEHFSKWKTLLIDKVKKESAHLPSNKISCIQNPRNPIYMMYTSGSTGKPKGVIIPHCAVVNLVSTINFIGLSQSERIAQFSNLAFDASIFEIWSALLNGGKLFIVPSDARKNHDRLKNFLVKYKVQYLFLTTGYFHQLVQVAPDALDSLKVLAFGGEQVNANAIHKFIRHRNEIRLPIRLVNGYGPTETTVFTCRQTISFSHCEQLENKTDLESIGKPIGNVKLYILNEKRQPVTQGDIGELYVSGINLALGYCHNDELNKEKFIANPFDFHDPFRRLYKTGDLVKQLPNGNLLYMGRVDDQVKVRGFRVHLSEIENQLLLHPSISSAAIIAEKDAGGRTRLIAYLTVFSEKENLSSDDIRKYLTEHLPSYMLPVKYIRVDTLPLSDVGKIDRKRLKGLDGIDLENAPISIPINFSEKRLKEIWAELLDTTNIDVTRNLFEMGADSLLVVEASHKISQALGCVCSLATLLTYPSIRKLSSYFEKEMHSRGIAEK